MSCTACGVSEARDGTGHLAGRDVQLTLGPWCLFLSSIANISAAVWLQAPQAPAMYVHVAYKTVPLVVLLAMFTSYIQLCRWEGSTVALIMVKMDECTVFKDIVFTLFAAYI